MIDINNYRFNNEVIKEFIKKNNLSVNQFCVVCKIKKCTYKKMMSGSLKFDINSICNICDLLKISSDSLVVKK